MLLLKLISKKIEDVKEKIAHGKQRRRANSRRSTYYYLKSNHKRSTN